MSADILYKSQQACWDCENAYGGCPWTEIDTATKKVKFQPIPGWDATKIVRTNGNNKKGQPRIIVSYDIRSCPMHKKEVTT